MEAKVIEVLEKVRPALQRDGGDVEFVELQDGVVKVRLKGACGNCPGATATLKGFIERVLVHEVEGVKSVERVM